MLLQLNFAKRSILVSYMTMLSMQCHATLEEDFHGAEHEVILRLLYRHFSMVSLDYLHVSRSPMAR